MMLLAAFGSIGAVMALLAWGLTQAPPPSTHTPRRVDPLARTAPQREGRGSRPIHAVDSFDAYVYTELFR